LAGGNLRLQSNSPCINTGTNAYVVGATDLDGRPRVVSGTVDMGAYEFQPDVSGAFVSWLQQNQLATDGSADHTDADGDGLDNWQEYRLGRNPQLWDNFRLENGQSLPDGGFQLTVYGQPGQSYALQASTNLGDWTPIMMVNCVYSNGTATVMDPASGNFSRRFYRLAPLSSVPAPKLGLRLSAAVSNGVDLSVTGMAGFNYRVETSSNLVDWEFLADLANTNGVMAFRDGASANYTQRFYRVVMH